MWVVSMVRSARHYHPQPQTPGSLLRCGALNFSVTKDATWLNVSPTSGAAPQELIVSANHSGLAIGTYQGHVTVTSPGVSGSPHTITVTLKIDSIPNYTVHLPLVLK
jgi:hypothetical protein